MDLVNDTNTASPAEFLANLVHQRKLEETIYKTYQHSSIKLITKHILDCIYSSNLAPQKPLLVIEIMLNQSGQTKNTEEEYVELYQTSSCQAQYCYHRCITHNNAKYSPIDSIKTRYILPSGTVSLLKHIFKNKVELYYLTPPSPTQATQDEHVRNQSNLSEPLSA